MSASERPLCLLGATGSIGRSTLDVATTLGIPVHTLTAHRRAHELADLAIAHRAERAVIADDSAWSELRDALAGSGIEAAAGAGALAEAPAAAGIGAVVTAIVGGAGLAATLTAVRAGKRVCIANKEPLVMAGGLITSEAARHGATLLPIDSEHSAIFQCLEGHRPEEVARLVITGSGGPFRTRADLAAVSVQDALQHPTWSMGPKITIDSATLANKANEVIEAHHLFALSCQRIEVVIHPQSVVHSMVDFVDGSTIAQLGEPDMRTPIQYSLSWPEHVPGAVPCCDLVGRGQLTFEPPDRSRFPLLDLGYAAAAAGGLAPVVFNAANETAVEAFLAGTIAFLDIPRRVSAALERAPSVADPDLETILACDADTRAATA